MSTTAQAHHRIFGIQMFICIVAFFGLTIFTTLGAVLELRRIDASKTATQDAAQRIQFWQIVAGKEPLHDVSSSNKLAFTLYTDLFMEPNKDVLPDSILNFKAGANTYGGVDDELGFNPFNNAGVNSCKVCGSLSIVMLTNLKLIQTGHLDIVIAGEKIDPGDTTIHLTPFGLHNWIWFPAYYIIFTIGALMYAIHHDSKLWDYDPEIINWGKAVSDGNRWAFRSMLLSPLYFRTVIPLQRRFGKGREKMLQRMGLSSATRELQKALTELNEMPTGGLDHEAIYAIMEKKKDIQDLLESVDAQAELYSTGDHQYASQKNLAVRMSKVEKIIAANKPIIQSRLLASKEMEDQP